MWINMQVGIGGPTDLQRPDMTAVERLLLYRSRGKIIRFHWTGPSSACPGFSVGRCDTVLYCTSIQKVHLGVSSHSQQGHDGRFRNQVLFAIRRPLLPPLPTPVCLQLA